MPPKRPPKQAKSKGKAPSDARGVIGEGGRTFHEDMRESIADIQTSLEQLHDGQNRLEERLDEIVQGSPRRRPSGVSRNREQDRNEAVEDAQDGTDSEDEDHHPSTSRSTRNQTSTLPKIQSGGAAKEKVANKSAKAQGKANSNQKTGGKDTIPGSGIYINGYEEREGQGWGLGVDKNPEGNVDAILDKAKGSREPRGVRKNSAYGGTAPSRQSVKPTAVSQPSIPTSVRADAGSNGIEKSKKRKESGKQSLCLRIMKAKKSRCKEPCLTNRDSPFPFRHLAIPL